MYTWNSFILYRTEPVEFMCPRGQVILSVKCIIFYGPEAYLRHLTDRCRFLNCSVMMGGGCGGIRYEFTAYFWGERGGALRYEFITYRLGGGGGEGARCCHLKGQCHQIFCFRFFCMNCLPPSP
jgi:hypothetical protein